MLAEDPPRLLAEETITSTPPMMRSEASVISSPGATTASDASEDEPLRKPMPKSELTPWLSKEQRKNQQLVADQRAKIYIPEVEKVKRVIMGKIASCVKVATGSGDRQGSKYHSIEIDLVTSCAARRYSGISRARGRPRGGRRRASTGRSSRTRSICSRGS